MLITFHTIAILVIFQVMYAAAQDAVTVIATVIRINGSLEYRESAEEQWKIADIGQGLFNGYGLRTGPGDRAIIVYGSGTRVLINENTELEIAAAAEGGVYTRPVMERAKLMIGEIYSRITPGTETGYEVETPSSVASVRGTEFNSLFREGLATFISLENVVQIMNQFGSVNINQFQMTRVPQGSGPENPTTLSADEARRLVGWVNNVDPEWRLNMIPQGGDRHETGTPFMITVWAQNRQTGAIDPGASFSLGRFESRQGNLEFSTDNMRSWSVTPQVVIVNGQANVHVRGIREGSDVIVCRAPDCEGAETEITILGEDAIKEVELRFTNPDGSGEETIILEMEQR